MAVDSLESIEIKISDVTAEIIIDESVIASVRSSQSRALANARKYALVVREESGLCRWVPPSVRDVDPMWDGSLFFGAGYTLPGKKRISAKLFSTEQRDQCEVQAGEMWKYIDKYHFKTEDLKIAEAELKEDIRYLKELQEIHTGLIQTGNEFIDLKDNEVQHDIIKENLNTRKARTTKARAEAGMPIALLVGIGAVIVIAIIIVFARRGS